MHCSGASGAARASPPAPALDSGLLLLLSGHADNRAESPMALAATAERNDSGIALSIAVLKQRFGERLSVSDALRQQHGHTTSWLPNQPPDAVVFVESAEEVGEIVRV